MSRGIKWLWLTLSWIIITFTFNFQVFLYILWKDSSAVIKHTVPQDTLRQLAPFSLFSTSSRPFWLGSPREGGSERIFELDVRGGTPSMVSERGLRVGCLMAFSSLVLKLVLLANGQVLGVCRLRCHYWRNANVRLRKQAFTASALHPPALVREYLRDGEMTMKRKSIFKLIRQKTPAIFIYLQWVSKKTNRNVFNYSDRYIFLKFSNKWLKTETERRKRKKETGKKKISDVYAYSWYLQTMKREIYNSLKKTSNTKFKRTDIFVPACRTLCIFLLKYDKSW